MLDILTGAHIVVVSWTSRSPVARQRRARFASLADMRTGSLQEVDIARYKERKINKYIHTYVDSSYVFVDKRIGFPCFHRQASTLDIHFTSKVDFPLPARGFRTFFAMCQV